jgi:ABC-type molybdenum transport system ATPase subunit/photorepair protein PhrA
MSYQTKVRANYMDKNAKLAFFTARKRQGDTTRIAEQTGYSVSHVTNIASGTRKVNDTVADAMYALTRRRAKNSELA